MVHSMRYEQKARGIDLGRDTVDMVPKFRRSSWFNFRERSAVLPASSAASGVSGSLRGLCSSQEAALCAC